MLVAVVAFTIFVSPKKWGRAKSLYTVSTVALVAFIPSCIGITMMVDAVRFGDFTYASYSDIPDFRSQRYLPEAATSITMRKYGSGYYAHYKISELDFESYLNGLLKTYGEYSAVKRGGFSNEGEAIDREYFNAIFSDLGWDCPANGIVYHSPSEGDGGGATYYLDPEKGEAFQRTGFW